MNIPFPEKWTFTPEWGWPWSQIVKIKSESDSPTQKNLKSGIIHDWAKLVAILIFFSKWRPPRGRHSWRPAEIETVCYCGHMCQFSRFWKNLNQTAYMLPLCPCPASNVPLGQRCIMVSMVAVCMLLLGQRCIMVGVFTVWMSPLAQRKANVWKLLQIWGNAPTFRQPKFDFSKL